MNYKTTIVTFIQNLPWIGKERIGDGKVNRRRITNTHTAKQGCEG